MVCLNKNEQGAELLTGYLAKTLDAEGLAEVNRHIQNCEECRALVTVWKKLDEFTAPEVTPGFDARLYSRLAAEGARRHWWRRLLWRPLAPLAAAGALVGLALFVQNPRTPDAPKQPSKAEIEQVAQALDDLDLLSFR